ncbi:hypothetical protein J3R82DRAFT_4801 [Butyriboletus roseoflavus]|nr:hypothetical protein J3R82DRAFT_4801 [Butyriboletus roseoflavus]
MKFSLSLGRPSSLMGHSSSQSQPKHPDSQLHVGNLNNEVEKQQPANAGSQWPPSSLAAPPPYTSATVAPEIQMNGVRLMSPSSAAAGSSETSESMPLPPGSRRTRMFMIHPAFASTDRLRDIAYLQAPMRRESKENALDMLRQYDTVIIMDDSASMLQDHRWEQACEALSGLAQTAATYDRDGIDIHFLNHPKYGVNIKASDSLLSANYSGTCDHKGSRRLPTNSTSWSEIISRNSKKPLGRNRKEIRLPSNRSSPINFIVITDGAPSKLFVYSIVSLARRLDRGNYPLAQVREIVQRLTWRPIRGCKRSECQFVQIGDDEGATEFLKQLDDDVSSTYGDIVDTTPFLGIKLTAEMLIKILLGGVNRRVDRRGGQAVMNISESLVVRLTASSSILAINADYPPTMSVLPPLPTKWVFDTSRDPPVYTRPMVGSELAMQEHWNTFDADGEVCLGVNFSSSLRIEELKGRARTALDKLRFVCPIIACTVEDVVSPRWVYTPSADREAWLNLALVVEERGASLNPSEFVQGINLKRLPYTAGNGATTFLKIYLLTTSKEGDDDNREYGLYFHGSHTIIDAGPALHALNLMCEWISDEGIDVRIEPSEEWKNLPVDPITATGGPAKEWETVGPRLLQELAEQNARTVPCHSLTPPSRPLNMFDPPLRYTITLSESESATIVAETKKLGVTVSALFHAAHCLAQFKMNPIPGTATEVDFSSDVTVVSLERYMKPPVNPRTHFISSFTLMPLRFSMAQPLTERSEKGRLIATAKALQERFDRYLADPCLPHLLAATASMSPTRVEQDDNTKLGGKAEAEETPMAPWACAFNNLGVIEKRLRTQHGRITVGSICIGNRLRSCM